MGSDFFEEKDHVDWSLLDAYKDKTMGDLIGPQHPFKVEFVQKIAQQECDSVCIYITLSLTY